MPIARPQIGAQEFLLLGQGPRDPSLRLGAFAQALADITRPGIDGQAYAKVGKRGEPTVNVSCVDIDTAANAKTRVAAYEALCESLQTVKDGRGNSWPFVRVKLIETFIQAIGTSSGGLAGATPAVLLWATWELQRTEA